MPFRTTKEPGFGLFGFSLPPEVFAVTVMTTSLIPSEITNVVLRVPSKLDLSRLTVTTEFPTPATVHLSDKKEIAED